MKALAIFALIPLMATGQQRWDTTALLQLGKDEGKVPAWLDEADSASVQIRGPLAYSCFTDKQSGLQWVAIASSAKVRKYLDGATWLSAGDPQPITQKDWNVCFTGTMPGALGQPIYSGIIHTTIARTSPLDWARMNTSNVVGASIAGEPCGAKVPVTVTGNADPKVGWYVVRNGMSLCRAL